MDVIALTKACVSCVVAEDQKYGRQARMRAVTSSRPFSIVAFAIQTITQKVKSGKTEVTRITDSILRYVRAILFSNKKSETLTLALSGQWVSAFGLVETLLSDCAQSFMSDVVRNFSERLKTARLTVVPFYPQENCSVEWRSQTFRKHNACFAYSGRSEWD